MLQGHAQHVFLLQGDGGLKERESFQRKMTSVPKEDTMVAVAIGQYIGEGFNYPRLDTLLLAMLISFEGSEEQYAGRLNRDYDGKKDVIIFDFQNYRETYDSDIQPTKTELVISSPGLGSQKVWLNTVRARSYNLMN